MIIPDINLLLYAYDAASPFHAKAVAWWQACLSGEEPVGLPQVGRGTAHGGRGFRALPEPPLAESDHRYRQQVLAQRSASLSFDIAVIRSVVDGR